MRSVLLSMALVVGLSSAVKAAEAKYPILNEVELLEKIKKNGLELIKAGKAKGTKDFCKQLHDRATCELTLAPKRTEVIGDKELYASACESIFIIVGMVKSKDQPGDWDFASGTAFAVTADGVLSTCRHVFDEGDPLDAFFVVNLAGDVTPVEEVLAADLKKDTCLFRIAAQNLKPLPLGENVAPGSKVRVVSHPAEFFYYFSSGTVGNYFQDEDKITWLNITADFGQGSSGAPVFDENGNVVGQVDSTYTLFAGGGSLESQPPANKCRRLTADHRVIPVAKPKPAGDGKEAAPMGKAKPKPPADGKEASPMGKGKKKKKPEPMPEPPGDPQMVFKMCTTAEGLRSLVQEKK